MDPNINENFYRKKLIKSKSGLRIVLVNEKYSSPFLLCEPYWVPDNEITHCTSCKGKFNFTKRKHHCRRCGRIYCSLCSCSKVSLPRMSFVDPVRVCEKCAHITEQESDFFNKRIKTLMNGATFLLSPLRESNTTCLCLCKLSADHKYLEFDTAANLPPLPLESVTKFNISHDTGGSYIEISYENGGFRLTTGPETTKPQALEWIEAMNEAFRLIGVSSSGWIVKYFHAGVSRDQCHIVPRLRNHCWAFYKRRNDERIHFNVPWEKSVRRRELVDGNTGSYI